MPEEGSPLPGSSYEELVKIIRAYDHFAGEVSLPEVSSVAGMHVSNVSRNNAFLVYIGVIEGRKKKSMTEAGRSLARALDHSIQEEIVRNWQSIVAANDFLKRIIAAVRIRKGMEYSALQPHVAYTAGQPKSPPVMAGSGAVVDILKAAGALQEEDRKLLAMDVPGTVEIVGSPITGELIASSPPVFKISDNQIQSQREGSPSGTVPISIQIQIQCSAQDVEGLAPEVRKLLNELRLSNPPVRRRKNNDALLSGNGGTGHRGC